VESAQKGDAGTLEKEFLFFISFLKNPMGSLSNKLRGSLWKKGGNNPQFSKEQPRKIVVALSSLPFLSSRFTIRAYKSTNLYSIYITGIVLQWRLQLPEEHMLRGKALSLGSLGDRTKIPHPPIRYVHSSYPKISSSLVEKIIFIVAFVPINQATAV